MIRSLRFINNGKPGSSNLNCLWNYIQPNAVRLIQSKDFIHFFDVYHLEYYELNRKEFEFHL